MRAPLLFMVLLPACLDLGGSWDSTSTTATTTSTSASSSTTAGTTGMTGATSGSSATAAATVAGTETETETAGCMFLGCADTPDPGNVDCDVWGQDCPEGQKCMPYANDGGTAWNALKCTPVVPNPDQPGEPCVVELDPYSGFDSCEEGAMCWDVDPETNEGVCLAMCTGSRVDPMCAPGFYCPLLADGTIILCHPLCDPLAQDCPPDERCVPDSGGHDGFWECVPASSGDGQYGDPCSLHCAQGLACVGSKYVPGCQADSCCTPWCSTSTPDPCPGEGQACVPWYDEGDAPEGYEDLGLCRAP